MSDPTRHAEAVVFDAYGTMLDVHAAVARHAARPGSCASAVSALLRAKQLEQSWILDATGDHADFAALTARALDFASATHGVADDALRADLLATCRRLDAFPDAAPAQPVEYGFDRLARRITTLADLPGLPA